MIDLLLALAGLPFSAASAYLGALAILARRENPLTKLVPHLRFDVVVPAHNEEVDIANTVGSLSSLDYPAALFRIIVIADNCTDSTAVRAATAGAHVWRRVDPQHVGKGYALAFAAARSVEEGFADAVVIVDADTTVSRNLLTAFAAHFDAGEQALQTEYAVRSSESTWRTRLMRIAFAAFHGVRSLGRERLHLSCGLRGNGMAFTANVLRSHPYRAFSIVEDVQYGLELALAGIRVAYVPEAAVWGKMAATERAARSQRQRWEVGRRQLTRQYVTRLVSAAKSKRDPVLLDLAADLLVPPLAQLSAVSFLGFAICVVTIFVSGPVPIALVVWGSACLGIIGYVTKAWALSGVGPRGLLDLAYAPLYVIWKLTLRFRRDDGRPEGRWIRTSRQAEP